MVLMCGSYLLMFSFAFFLSLFICLYIIHWCPFKFKVISLLGLSWLSCIITKGWNKKKNQGSFGPICQNFQGPHNFMRAQSLMGLKTGLLPPQNVIFEGPHDIFQADGSRARLISTTPYNCYNKCDRPPQTTR